MKVIHPKTQATLIMNAQCHWIAEIEAPSVKVPEFVSVTIGLVGCPPAMIVYREDWQGFKALINEIDQECMK